MNTVELTRARPALSSRAKTSFKAVEAWAFFGGVLLIFQLYVWTKWVTGPYFVEVPAGPSDPPTFMKMLLLAQSAFTCIWFPVSIYYFLIRPWRQERRITTDGLLLLSFGLMCFQDPLLNYTNTWETYNSWLFNRGSWTQGIPGWHSWATPGHMVPEPMLIILPGYSGVLLCTMAVCWFMRFVKTRRPDIGTPVLLAATRRTCASVMS
jgi:hypothetical protein